MQTIGFLELNSIAKGIEAADYMLKAADVDLISAKPSCPGKYQILVVGEVSAVQSSIDVGEEIGGSSVIEKLVIARIHPQVIQAINMSTIPEGINAVGVMEFFDVTTSIMAADAAVKAAGVTLLEVRLGTGIGGKSFVTLTGDVAAINEGVESGSKYGIEKGMLVNSVVIPNPHIDLFQSLY